MNAAFSAGSVISRTFSVWGRNVSAFSAVALLVHLPNFALALFAEPPHPSRGGGLLTGVNSILSVILGFAATGALTYGVLQALRGQAIRVGEIAGMGFRKIWPIFVVSLGIAVLAALAAILLVIPGVMLLCALWVAVPAIVVEKGLSIGGSFRRSRELTKGHRFSIFVILLLFWLISAAAGMFAGLLLPLGLRAVIPYGLVSLLWQVVAVIAGGLFSTACAVAYHDLRVAKEGVDTAQLVAVFE